MKTFITMILTLLAVASFSFAEDGGVSDAGLLARAESRATTASFYVRNGETSGRNSVSIAPAPKDTGEVLGDAALSVENELASEMDKGLSYDSPELRAEDLPLVMSSADRKTISVVMPPFLYFRTQF